MDNKLPEARLPQEFILDAFADPSSVRDVVRGILHTIFHHRYFPTITPHTHDVLDLTLPYVAEPELETLIDQRTAALVADLSSSAPSTPSSLPQQAKAMLGGVVGGGGGGAREGGSGGGRGRVTVQFMEKNKAGRRRMGMWGGKGEEDVCWESWTVRVTVAEPKTDSERAKVRRATASTLLTTTMKIITSVNTYKDHIPPITMQGDANPFPYAITVNQRNESGGGGMMRGFF
ncbi:hypothetical protein N0V93_005885 [Gnomoniopsis smithogilvyi]|uniref:Autophagy-related protein 101 n=1 Tax=Gnomoniopsis smithogilvyi TaxID=1191159 RepID=A0A9W8YWF2_9PEZI|nr:hypothetical protein N0V93_005885 [Gnomoniopsis smithogilvyi]